MITKQLKWKWAEYTARKQGSWMKYKHLANSISEVSNDREDDLP